jgi:epsilon-lactone hydrolase
MPSLHSQLIALALRALRVKTRGLGALQPRTPPVPTRSMRERFQVTERQVQGRMVYTVAPRDSAATSGHVLYLHGGAYINSFSKQHWSFIGQLVERLGCTVTAPDYGLAPRHTVDDAFTLLLALYRELVDASGASRLTVMGDSAGGGLGLALAQELRLHGLPQPGHLVLLSPWLDVALENPGIAAVDALDPFLGVPRLREAGRTWAGQRDVRDPRVSPLYGPLEGLAPITLYMGTHDIFVADARTFREQVRTVGGALDYVEVEGMLHVWMLLGLPESKSVLQHLVAKLGTSVGIS